MSDPLGPLLGLNGAVLALPVLLLIVAFVPGLVRDAVSHFSERKPE